MMKAPSNEGAFLVAAASIGKPLDGGILVTVRVGQPAVGFASDRFNL